MAGRREKTRLVGMEPEYVGFSPEGYASAGDIRLGVDEIEALRLLDLERLSQAEAAARMRVARTTVQSIAERAHAKVADALGNGRRIVVEGGNVAYVPARKAESAPWPKKGKGIMRIAVTYDNGNVFQHFGRTEQFKIYDVEDGKVVSSQVVGSNGAGHGALAGVLAKGGVDVLICGGIGGGAINALASTGIAIYAGAQGDCDAAVQALLEGRAEQAAEPTCGCHGEGHDHEDGHGCGCHGEGHDHEEGCGCGCH